MLIVVEAFKVCNQYSLMLVKLLRIGKENEANTEDGFILSIAARKGLFFDTAM